MTHSDREHSCREGGREISNDVVVTRDDQIACHDTIGRFIAWRVGLGLAPACAAIESEPLLLRESSVPERVLP